MEKKEYPYHNIVREISLSFAVELLKSRSVNQGDVIRYARHFEKYLLDQDDSRDE